MGVTVRSAFAQSGEKDYTGIVSMFIRGLFGFIWPNKTPQPVQVLLAAMRRHVSAGGRLIEYACATLAHQVSVRSTPAFLFDFIWFHSIYLFDLMRFEACGCGWAPYRVCLRHPRPPGVCPFHPSLFVFAFIRLHLI